MEGFKINLRSFIIPKNIAVFGMIVLYGLMFFSTQDLQAGKSFDLFFVTFTSLILAFVSFQLIPRGIRLAMPFLIFVLIYYLTVTLRPYFSLLQKVREDYPFAGSVSEIISATWVGVVAQIGFFFGLLLTHIITGGFRGVTKEQRVMPFRINWKKLFRQLFFIFLIITPAVNIIVMRLGIGFMGGPEATLPFRLGGILVAVRALTIPLGLFLIQCAYQSGSKRAKQVSIFLFLVNTAVIVLGTSSRGVIIGAGISLLLLYIFMARSINYKKITLVLSGLVLVAVVFFPFITSFRSVGHTSLGQFDAALLQKVYKQYQEAYKSKEDFNYVQMFYEFIIRYTGTETVVPMVRSGEGVIGSRRAINIFSGKDQYVSLGEYYVRRVLLIPTTHRGGYAVGLIGEFYMIGGKTAVVLGFLILFFVVYWLWRRVIKSNLIIRPVLLVYITLSLLSVYTEGKIIQEAISDKGFIVPIVFFTVLEIFAKQYRMRLKIVKTI